jgi:hypothetical protein
MNAPGLAPRHVCLFSLGVLTLLVVGFALYWKGDVKAAVKMFGIELSIETKDSPRK